MANSHNRKVAFTLICNLLFFLCVLLRTEGFPFVFVPTERHLKIFLFCVVVVMIFSSPLAWGFLIFLTCHVSRSGSQPWTLIQLKVLKSKVKEEIYYKIRLMLVQFCSWKLNFLSNKFVIVLCPYYFFRFQSPCPRIINISFGCSRGCQLLCC